MAKVLDTQTSPSYKLEDLPKQGPNLLLDTAAIQRKYTARRDNPFRVLEGFLRVPSDMSATTLEKLVKARVERFIRWKGMEGWTLKGRIELIGPEVSRDSSGIAVLGERQYRMKGVFAIVPKPVRVMLRPETVMQAPDDVLPETHANATALAKKYSKRHKPQRANGRKEGV